MTKATGNLFGPSEVPSVLGTGPVAPIATFDPEPAREFLDALWGQAEQGSLGVWVLADQQKPTYWAQADADWWPLLGGKLAAFHGRYNLYANVAVRKPGMFDLKERGSEADITGLPGMWLDLDFISDYHADATFVDEAAVMAFVKDSLGHHGLGELEPTMVVNSGGGMQLWWLFDELLDDLGAMIELRDRWERFWLAQGERLSHKVDWVWQLTQPMRIPGTWNVRARAQARLLHHDDSARYSPSDLLEHLPELTSAETRARVARIAFGDGEAQPADATAGPIGWANSRIDLYKQYLEEDGWKFTRPRQVHRYNTDGEMVEDHLYWEVTRPGKDPRDGTSASFNNAGLQRLYVFSTSAYVPSRNPKTIGEMVKVPDHKALTFFEFMKETSGGGGPIGFDYADNRCKEMWDEPSPLPTPEERAARVQRVDEERQASGDDRVGFHGRQGNRHLLVSNVVSELTKQRDHTPNCWEGVHLFRSMVHEPPTPVRIHEHNNDNGATMENLDAISITTLVDQVCVIKRKPEGEPVTLTRDEAAAVMKGPWNELRPFRGFVDAPFINHEGELITTPGYDMRSGKWVRGKVMNYTPPNRYVTADDARRAASWLLDEGPLEGFYWADSGDRAAALTLLGSGISRNMIDGPVVMYLVTARKNQSGKSALVETVWNTVCGSKPFSSSTFSANQDEFRKSLTAEFNDYGVQPLIVFDEVNNVVVRHSVLADVVSKQSLKDRILRSSHKVEVLGIDSVVIMAGNNVDVAGDLDRRTMRIDLERTVGRRETSFQRSNPGRWALEHRMHTIEAWMTMVWAWDAAGRPPGPTKPLDNFEKWSEFVDGVLAYAGVQGFDPGELVVNDELGDGDELTQAWAVILGTAKEMQSQVHLGSKNDPWEVGKLMARADVPEAITLRAAIMRVCENPRWTSAADFSDSLGRRIKTLLNEPVAGLLLTDGGRGRSGARRYWVVDATPSRMSVDQLL